MSTHVLEYIDDVEAALTELARVTRTGGRFVNVATLWDSLVVHGADPALTREIVAAWDRHAPHPNLPADLPNLLSGAGFTAVTRTPLPIVNRAVEPSTWAHGIARLMAGFASTTDAVEAEAATAWLDGVDHAAGRGDLLMTVLPILTTATRGGPASPA